MQNKELLEIKEIISSKLIKLVQKPLLKYINILLKNLIIFNLQYQNSTKQSSLQRNIEQFQFTLKQIKKLIIDCSNINDVNTIYNELLIFLNQCDSLDDNRFNVFQPLIIKFHYFQIFFESFKIINDINDKVNNGSPWNVSLKKEMKWFIKFTEDLLNRLTIESQNNDMIGYNNIIKNDSKIHNNKLLTRRYKLNTL
ncbi:hypothetical protein MOUN0_D01530 [Monosporozyma unispora]|nr:hypothetical protein C6P44_002523 [Kazachstania unispora]